MKYWRVVAFLVFTQIAASEQFLFEVFTKDHKSFYLIKAPSRLSSAQELWNYFFCMSIDLPRLLEQAQVTSKPVILSCQEQLHGFGPLDDEAPLIEANRVALAWLSAYARATDVQAFAYLQAGDDNACSLQLYSYIQWFIDQCDSDYQCTDFSAHVFRSADLSKVCVNHLEAPTQIKSIALLQEGPKHLIKVKNQNHINRRVLISGGAGFIGCYLTKKLLEKGFSVVVLDNFFCSQPDTIQQLEHDYDLCEFHYVDVTKDFYLDCAVDLVIHLASLPSPKTYYQYPVNTLLTGLSGTKNCLDVALSSNAPFIFASSSEVYGDPEISPQVESYEGNVNPWGMRSQYDESKRGGETLCKWYFEHAKVNVKLARIFNTYGPGMCLDDGRVITNFLKAILERTAMLIYGNGKQTRSFCYIDDLISGLMRLIEHKTEAQHITQRVYNIGNDNEIAIERVARLVNEIAHEAIGYIVPIEHIIHPDTTDPKMRRPNLNRLKALGCQPQISFKKGLQATLKVFIEKTKLEKK